MSSITDTQLARVSNACSDCFFAIKTLCLAADSDVLREIVARRYYRVDITQESNFLGIDGEKVYGKVVDYDASVPEQIVKDVRKALRKGMPRDPKLRELIAEFVALYFRLKNEPHAAAMDRAKALLKELFPGMANCVNF